MNLLVETKVRRLVLDIAATHRKLASTGEPRFTRVSREFLDTLEVLSTSYIRTYIEARVHQLPSKGRTV